MDGLSSTLRITSNNDSGVTLTASSGEIDGNSEYVKSPENSPTSSANTPELEGCIREIQYMHKDTKVDIDGIDQPTEIFNQTNELNPTDTSNNKTTLAKNHQDNGAMPPLGTQPPSLHSLLAYTLVTTDKPLPCPCVESGYAAHLARKEDLPEVCIKISDNMIYEVYQDWVHQNPGTIWMEEPNRMIMLS